MKIYLASRYSRREELCGYREILQAAGHVVTSRWLNGKHQITDDGQPIGDAGEALVEGDSGSQSAKAAKMRREFANEDMKDVCECDVIICFTESPRSTASRGGRHVELGIVIGLNIANGDRFTGEEIISIVIVGPRENLFHWIPVAYRFDTFDAAMQHIEILAT